MVPACLTAVPKSNRLRVTRSSMLLDTALHKIKLISPNFKIDLANSIKALVPNMRAKPDIGLSLLNLGTNMPKENTKPPLSTVETVATKASKTMMGRIKI